MKLRRLLAAAAITAMPLAGIAAIVAPTAAHATTAIWNEDASGVPAVGAAYGSPYTLWISGSRDETFTTSSDGTHYFSELHATLPLVCIEGGNGDYVYADPDTGQLLNEESGCHTEAAWAVECVTGTDFTVFVSYLYYVDRDQYWAWGTYPTNGVDQWITDTAGDSYYVPGLCGAT